MKPDYIGLGAFRCGTTSLAAVLRKHPQVHLWKYKETYFWNKRFTSQPVTWYKSQFQENRVSGEITPSYFGQPRVIERIRSHCPGVKFLLLLRDPVQTVISAYWMRRSWGKIKKGLDEFVDEIVAGERPRWIESRNYTNLLKLWLLFFKREQFWIAKSETLWENWNNTLDTLWKFLEVQPMRLSYFPKESHIEREEKTSAAAVEKLEAIFRPMEDSLVSLLGQEFRWD